VCSQNLTSSVFQVLTVRQIGVNNLIGEGRLTVSDAALTKRGAR
jgi:hypothetical protein